MLMRLITSDMIHLHCCFFHSASSFSYMSARDWAKLGEMISTMPMFYIIAD
jgi:hypothetical protein